MLEGIGVLAARIKIRNGLIKTPLAFPDYE
jgi:hypothetical protein